MTTMKFNNVQLRQIVATWNRLAEHQKLLATDPVYRARHEAEERATFVQMLAEMRAAEAAEKRAREADKEYFTSDDFKQEVIAALVASGATQMQAEGRTRDQARLFKEAGALGLM